MSVIAATMAREISEANKLLKSGMKLEDLISKLAKETANIRYSGNGYSQQWIDEAKRRNLYVNTDFVENIENIKTNGDVLVEAGVYTRN